MKYDIAVAIRFYILQEELSVSRLRLDGDDSSGRADPLSFQESVVSDIAADINYSHARLQALSKKPASTRLVHAIDGQFNRHSFVVRIQCELVTTNREGGAAGGSVPPPGKSGIAIDEGFAAMVENFTRGFG